MTTDRLCGRQFRVEVRVWLPKNSFGCTRSGGVGDVSVAPVSVTRKGEPC